MTLVSTALLVIQPAAAAAEVQCDDIIVIGARGSGQTATGDNSGIKVGAKYQGLGNEVAAITKALDDGLGEEYGTVGVQAIEYPSLSVDVLKPNKLEIALAQRNPQLALELWLTTNFRRFTASINEGLGKAVSAIETTASNCPTSQIVLIGYSQGAIVMHDAIEQVGRSNALAISRVKLAILLADGDKGKVSDAQFFGTAGKKSTGVRVATSTVISESDPAKYVTTVTICNKHDPVCDFNIPKFWTLDTSVHGSYLKKNLTLSTEPQKAVVWGMTKLQKRPQGTQLSVKAVRSSWSASDHTWTVDIDASSPWGFGDTPFEESTLHLGVYCTLADDPYHAVYSYGTVYANETLVAGTRTDGTFRVQQFMDVERYPEYVGSVCRAYLARVTGPDNLIIAYGDESDPQHSNPFNAAFTMTA